MSKKTRATATDSIVETFTDAVLAEQQATEDILARTLDIWAGMAVVNLALKRIEKTLSRIVELLERNDA